MKVYGINLRGIVVFIAVLFTSMLGAQLFGVSLNKIALIPLLLVLFYDNINNRRIGVLNSSTAILLIFYIFSMFSCVMALFADYAGKYEGYLSSNILFIVQILIFYIPLLIFMGNAPNKEVYFAYFLKFIVVIARLNLIWAIIQFVIYFFTGIDINLYTVAHLYNSGSYVYSSPLLYLDGAGTFLRATGLSYEPAYYGLILVIGACFDKKIVYKILYFVGALMAVSRMAIVTLLFVYFINICRAVARSKGIIRLNGKVKTAIGVIVILLACAVVVSVWFDLSGIIRLLISKFNLKSDGDIGTSRHILYPTAALYILFNKYNLLQFLFGFGPRNSGTILVNFAPQYNGLMLPSFLSEAWATECDVSELLLGYGVVGFILYVVLMLKNFKLRNQYSVIYLAFLLIGIMYDISSATYLNLFMIFTCAGFCNFAYRSDFARSEVKSKKVNALQKRVGNNV